MTVGVDIMTNADRQLGGFATHLPENVTRRAFTLRVTVNAVLRMVEWNLRFVTEELISAGAIL